MFGMPAARERKHFDSSSEPHRANAVNGRSQQLERREHLAGGGSLTSSLQNLVKLGLVQQLWVLRAYGLLQSACCEIPEVAAGN